MEKQILIEQTTTTTTGTRTRTTRKYFNEKMGKCEN